MGSAPTITAAAALAVARLTIAPNVPPSIMLLIPTFNPADTTPPRAARKISSGLPPCRAATAALILADLITCVNNVCCAGPLSNDAAPALFNGTPINLAASAAVHTAGEVAGAVVPNEMAAWLISLATALAN